MASWLAAPRFGTAAIFAILFLCIFDTSCCCSTLTFVLSSYNVNISEHAPVGQAVLQVSALNSNPLIQYQLVNTTSNFSMSPNGTLLVARPLDRETTPLYSLTVSASNSAPPFDSTFTQVFVRLLDFPDNYPLFSEQEYTVWVFGNESIRMPFYSVSATTKDSFPLRYHIIGGGNDASFFELDRLTGQLSLLSPLYHEYKSTYWIVIEASSVQDPLLATDVVLEVRVVQPVVTAFTREEYSFVVSNETGVGVVFGFVFLSSCNVSDSDLPSVTYSIDNEGNNNLAIDNSTGGISLNNHLRNGFTQGTVTATNENGFSTSAHVNVTVVSSSSSAGLDRTHYVIEVTDDIKGGSTIATIDGEGWNSFEMLSGDCGVFYINDSTGEIRVRSSPRPAVYWLTVGVSCNGIVTPVRVEVRVTNVNNPPSFDRDIYRVTVSEGVSIGWPLLQLSVTDSDPGANGTVEVTSTDLPSSLNLRTSGLLTVGGRLDRETTPILNFTVSASDSGTPSLTSTARIIITLLDIDNNPPVFQRSMYSGTVVENAPPGTGIVTLQINDPDESAVSYRLLGPKESLSLLFITPSGELQSRLPIDRERYPHLNVTVRAESISNSSQYTDTEVYVTVLNTVDTVPVFLSESYTVQLMGPVPSGSDLLTVQAISQDNTSDITYTILNSTQVFSIHYKTGQVTASAGLSVAVYSFTVQANSSSLTSTAIVTVTVGNESPTPRIRPSTLYVSTFNYLLPLALSLGELTTPTEGRLGLGPSRCGAERHFQLNGSHLYMLNTATSGKHSLNVSLTTSSGEVWYQSVGVVVNLISNDTVSNGAVSLIFPNLSLEHFLERFLSLLISHVTPLLGCSSSDWCLDVIGAQATPTGGVEVAVAARRPNLRSHVSREELRGTLELQQERLSSLLGWTMYVDIDKCSTVRCMGFRTCAVSLTLSSTLLTLTSPSLSLRSLPFVSAHSCDCPAEGYSADCQEEVNECATNPCEYGAECVDLIADYLCLCPDFTSGRNCTSVCPAASTCELCSPNPCLHGGTCEVQGGRRVCQNCPSGHTGPLCELTTAHLEGTGGHVALPSFERGRSIQFSFMFTGIQPNAILLYTGQFNNGKDYLLIELVLGVVRAEIQWGNWSTQATISSNIGPLNDGQWHSVSIQLDATEFTLTVGNCSELSVMVVERAATYCSVTRPVTTSLRTINMDSPVYLMGLPSASLLTNQLALTQFTGCLADVTINRKLVNFADVPYASNLRPGCPQIATTECTGCGSGGSCVSLWNGSRCVDNNGGNPVSFDGDSYSLIASSTLGTLNHVSIQIRTLQDQAVVMLLNHETTVKIFHGSVIFQHSSLNSSYSSLTLIADSHIRDGYWHTIALTLSSSHTRLSVDDGRAVADSDQGVVIENPQIQVGSDTELNNGFIGCVRSLTINSQSVNVMNANSVGVVSGCPDNDPCSSNTCPANSDCIEQWRSYTCQCSDSPRYYHPTNSTSCIDPCLPNPCKNGGRCGRDSGEANGFVCVCGAPFIGLTCTVDPRSSCQPEYYRSGDQCQPCICDRNGVTNQFCANDGTCYCNSSIATYSPGIGEAACKVCNCDPIGSNGTQCDSMGSCPCKPGVGGNRCDVCQTGYAGFGPDGCKEAIVINGQFVLDSLTFQSVWLDDSTVSNQIKTEILEQLNRFTLPANSFELSISLSNSSSRTAVTYQLTSYTPHTDSTVSPHMLASILQTIFTRDCFSSYYILQSNSHQLIADCLVNLCDPSADCNDTSSSDQQESFVCLECPTGTVLDGIICRSIMPQNCTSGIDSDLDGIPDTWDSCPYWFNPRQDVVTGCSGSGSGACLGEIAEGILWAVTNEGETDIRMCPTPLTGSATRVCRPDGNWEEPDFRDCRSFTGQQLEAVLQILNSRPPTSHNETIEVTHKVLSLVSANSTPLYCGDLRSAISVLSAILGLETLLPLDGTDLRPLVQILSHMSSPRLAVEWMRAGCSAESLIDIADELGSRIASSFSNGNRMLTVQTDTVDMSVSRYKGVQYNGLNYTLNDTSVSLPTDLITGAASSDDNVTVSLTHFKDLVFSLPFPSALRNVTIGAPVWSIQVLLNEAAVTELTTPISIRFPHPTDADSNVIAHCVTWNENLRAWNKSGCIAMETSNISTTCSCSHLSVFTLLLTPMEPTMAPKSLSQDLEVLFYGANALTFVFLVFLIVAIVASICCNGHLLTERNHFLKALLQLLFALLFLYTVFFGVDRTESSAVCVTVGLLLEYLSLTVVCLFVFTLLVVVINWEEKNKKWMFIVLNVLAWTVPLLYVGINTVGVYLAHSSMPDAYGYPELCWIKVSLSYLFYIPMFIIITLFLCLLLCLMIAHCQRPVTSDIQAHHMKMQRNAAIFLVSLFIFFVFNWTTTVLTLHSTKWEQVWQTILGVATLSSILVSALVLPCILFHIRIKEYFVYKFHLRDSSQKKLQKTSRWSTSSHPDDPVVLQQINPLSSCDPLYQTIDNATGDQHYYTQRHGSNRYPSLGMEAEQQMENETGSLESDSESERDSNVDLEAIHPIDVTAQQQPMYSEVTPPYPTREQPYAYEPPYSTRQPPYVHEPQYAQEPPLAAVSPKEWFQDLDGNLCSPMEPHSAVSSPVPAEETLYHNHKTVDAENTVDAEIDFLYQQTRVGRQAPPLPPTDETKGDYVELKTDPSDNVQCEPWYENPESVIGSHRHTNGIHGSYPSSSIPPPPVSAPAAAPSVKSSYPFQHQTTVPSLEDQFDDRAYAVITPEKFMSRKTSAPVLHSVSLADVSPPLPPERSPNASKFNTASNSHTNPRRGSVQSHRTGREKRMVDRRLSHDQTLKESVSTTLPLIGGVAPTSQQQILQHHNGSQTFVSLV